MSHTYPKNERNRDTRRAYRAARAAKRQTGRTLVWLLAFLCALGAAIAAGHAGELRVREALALKCARASDGTDTAIVDCYADRGLPAPHGVD